MGAEPGRHAAGVADGAERRELCLAVESVARLALPRRRSGLEHPAAVTVNRLCESRRPSSARGTHRGEDSAAGRVQLLVARATCAQRELLDAIAAERRVRVAVDETRHGAAASTVELLD